ncbi:MAG: hypothetical protein O7D91_21555 [Planctomycetota bacterium]|nr:hypothetical protein [Planctomycetota bacterium]
MNEAKGEDLRGDVEGWRNSYHAANDERIQFKAELDQLRKLVVSKGTEIARTNAENVRVRAQCARLKCVLAKDTGDDWEALEPES